MYDKVSKKLDFANNEAEVLKFWNEEKIFEKKFNPDQEKIKCTKEKKRITEEFQRILTEKKKNTEKTKKKILRDLKYHNISSIFMGRKVENFKNRNGL